MDRKDDILVAEVGAGRIRKLVRRPDGGWTVSTVSAGVIHTPEGIAVDPAGHLVVADCESHRVCRVDSTTGEVTVLVGDGTRGSRDGPGATARFEYPVDVAVDHRGDIFVAEVEGHRVRRISAVDGTVTTVAGCGAYGHADGAGAAAVLDSPSAVAVDGRGVLIVSDGDSKTYRLRRVAASADRTVTTVLVDNRFPSDLFVRGAIDHDGSLLVAVPDGHHIVRVTGLGLAPPWAPPWSLRAHRKLAVAMPAVATFVTAVMLCALRLDVAHDGTSEGAVPRLPVEMWLAVLSMLRPDHMLPRR